MWVANYFTTLVLVKARWMQATSICNLAVGCLCGSTSGNLNCKCPTPERCMHFDARSMAFGPKFQPWLAAGSTDPAGAALPASTTAFNILSILNWGPAAVLERQTRWCQQLAMSIEVLVCARLEPDAEHTCAPGCCWLSAGCALLESLDCLLCQIRVKPGEDVQGAGEHDEDRQAGRHACMQAGMVRCGWRVGEVASGHVHSAFETYTMWSVVDRSCCCFQNCQFN